MHDTFLISDTHFGHGNIIGYCHRPFKTLKEMDDTMIENWNRVVKDEDTVYFVGDFSYKNNRNYRRLLNGHIIFIKGNHDSYWISGYRAHDYAYIKYGDTVFYVVHDPEDVSNFHHGWSITGHVHDVGPFIDRKKKIVNVSVEQINYTPIKIEDIVKLVNGKV